MPMEPVICSSTSACGQVIASDRLIVSGVMPTMATDARLGCFDDLLGEHSPGTASALEPTARKLREIIPDDFPEAVEVVRLGDGAASYGIGPKKMSESHVYVMLQAE